MCTTAQLKNVLEDTRKGMQSIFGSKLEDLLLYGSYARGEETDESDIDVMVLVDLPKQELSKYRRNVSDFSVTVDLRYGVLLSIKLQDAESFSRYGDTLPFFINVKKEGISIVQ